MDDHSLPQDDDSDERHEQMDCTDPELMVIEACVDADIIEAVDDGNGAVSTYLRDVERMVSRGRTEAIRHVTEIADRIINEHH